MPMSRTFLLVAWGAASVLLAGAADARAQQQDPNGESVTRVLLLNSYSQAYEWTANMVAGAKDAFEQRDPNLLLYIEYMDSKRFWDGQDGVFARELAAMYKRKYADYQPDVIVSTDDNAFQFLLRRRDELFPGTPVVFCGVNSFDRSMIRGVSGVTGVVEKLDQKATIDLALQLSPNAKRVAVVTDTSPTGLENLAYLKELAPLYADTAPLVFLDPDGDGLMLDELLRQLRALPEDTVVLYMDFFRQRDGSYLDPADTIATVSRVSPAPVYSMGSHYLGKGIVGGRITRAYDQAHIAATMAGRILDGEKAEDIPVMWEGANRTMFDARQLQRFGIPLSRLPADSTVLYRTPSFYEENRVLAWTVASVVAVLLALITLMGVNIRQRKRAEETLRDSEQRLRLLFDSASAGIAQVTPDGQLLMVNHALAGMLGYSEEELLKKNFREITLTEDLVKEEPSIARVLAGEIDTYQIEKRYIHRDGGVFWVLMSSAVVRNEDGTPRYAICVVNDQTETRRLQADLIQSQKMEAIGRLAGGVAHDFNNKLQSILGYSELLLERMDENHEFRDDVREIRTAAQRSAELTAQLLAFARRQTVAPRILDINQTIEGMLRMLKRLIGEDIDLLWKPDGQGPVRIDPTQLDQILANLVVNARDALTSGGKITIETGNVEIDREYCASNPEATPGEYVLLAVSDNGPGMDAETLSNIFEPFFTTKKPNQGTGLGLATVYGIVKQNSGFIDVYSEPGEGTTFKIYLPRQEQSPETKQTQSEDDDTLPHRGHETILFVEDEPAILQLGKTMLDQLGYDVLTAKTPHEAIELTRKIGRPIDLLITDVVMPGMNGKDLSERLRERYPDLSRLFVSGYTANVIAHRGVLDDGVHFMQKPFTHADLAAKTREALDEG